MNRRWYPLVVFAAGCGDVSSKEDARVPDVGMPADSMVDAATTGRCSKTGTFGQPVPVGGINTNLSSEYGIRALPDELTAVFARRPASGDSEIYIATRSSTTEAFANVTLLAGVNTSVNDWSPTLTADALTLYHMVAGSTTDSDIQVSTRASVAANFSAPAALPVLNSTSDERDPYVLPAGNVLYFSRRDATSERIMRTTLSASGFATPQPVTELNVDNQQTFAPVVTPDELTIYFASTRPDAAAKGSFDIFVATRSTTSSPWGTPTILPTLNSATYDFPTWISPDGCVLYFTSDTLGSFDAYQVQRGM